MKSRGLIGALLFNLFLGFAQANQQPLEILCWNIHNYNLSDGLVEAVYRQGYPKPESDKAAFRQIIAQHSPDILILQEVGGEPFLNEIQRDLSKVGIKYEYTHWVKAEDKERMIVALSRLPFEVVDVRLPNFSYRGKKVTAKRGLLHIKTQLGSQPIDLLGMHLKSRYTDYPEDPKSAERREKEARAIRDYIRNLLTETPDRELLLMGDLNDRFGSAAYRRITQISGNDLLRELPVVDTQGYSWTYHYQKERVWEQVDFVFMSPSLVNHNRFKLNARIIDDPEAMIASDHRPLLIQLQLLQK